MTKGRGGGGGGLPTANKADHGVFCFLWVPSGADRVMGYVLKWILTGVAHGVLAKGNQINVRAVGRCRRRYVRRKNTGEEDGRGKTPNEKNIL